MNVKMQYRVAVLCVASVMLSAAVMTSAAMAAPATTSQSEESVTGDMDTVGGHIKTTTRPEADDVARQIIYLNGTEFYHTNIWSMSLDKKFRVGNTDVVIVSFVQGGNTPCIDSYGILGIRPNKTAYWINEDLSYCEASFAVVGDRLVMTDIVHDGRHTRTEKTTISLDGTITHAR